MNMRSGQRRTDTFQSPATPAIIRSRRSTGRRTSPPSSVRSNLFQSISDADTLPQIDHSPNRTPIVHRELEFEDFDLEAKVVLLTAQHAGNFGNYVEDFNTGGVIGLGSFSEVCKVESKRYPGNSFALKRCNKIFQSCRDRDQLLEEARILKLLSDSGSKYTTRFFSAWQENGFLYMLVEYAEYGSVLDILQKHGNRRLRIPDSFLWWMVHDACQGMHAVHTCGYVHLDIKPANLLVFGDRTIKLSDFGIASKIGSKDREGDSRYMARELLNDGGDRLQSADIFSFGVTLFEAAVIHTMESSRELDGIMGRPTFSLPTGGDGWHQLRDGIVPPLPDRLPLLITLLQNMLHPVPAQRPSAEQILLVPEVAMGRHVVENAAPQSPTPMSSLQCGAYFGMPDVLIEAVVPRPIVNRSSSYEPDMFSD